MQKKEVRTIDNGIPGGGFHKGFFSLEKNENFSQENFLEHYHDTNSSVGGETMIIFRLVFKVMKSM